LKIARPKEAPVVPGRTPDAWGPSFGPPGAGGWGGGQAAPWGGPSGFGTPGWGGQDPFATGPGFHGGPPRGFPSGPGAYGSPAKGGPSYGAFRGGRGGGGPGGAPRRTAYHPYGR